MRAGTGARTSKNTTVRRQLRTTSSAAGDNHMCVITVAIVRRRTRARATHACVHTHTHAHTRTPRGPTSAPTIAPGRGLGAIAPHTRCAHLSRRGSARRTRVHSRSLALAHTARAMCCGVRRSPPCVRHTEAHRCGSSPRRVMPGPPRHAACQCVVCAMQQLSCAAKLGGGARTTAAAVALAQSYQVAGAQPRHT